MSDQQKPPEPSLEAPSEWADWLGGGALGCLLGLLVGMSSTPVVTIIITALVALLAGLFGLSDKSPIKMSGAAVRRLAAFGLAASALIVVGVWLRTHDVLAPSVEQQKQMLRAMGYEDRSKEQTELLRYIRFGLLPAGLTVSKEAQPRSGVLYGDVPAGFCDGLARIQATPDLLVLLDTEASLRRTGERIRSMPPDRQAAAVEFAKLYLCGER
jgi:hypothetical protein